MGWGEPTCTLVPWRQGIQQRTSVWVGLPKSDLMAMIKVKCPSFTLKKSLCPLQVVAHVMVTYVG